MKKNIRNFFYFAGALAFLVGLTIAFTNMNHIGNAIVGLILLSLVIIYAYWNGHEE